MAESPQPFIGQWPPCSIVHACSYSAVGLLHKGERGNGQDGRRFEEGTAGGGRIEGLLPEGVQPERARNLPKHRTKGGFGGEDGGARSLDQEAWRRDCRGTKADC